MLGIVDPPVDESGAQVWMRHMCGICLAIRDSLGQTARLAVNHDAVLLAVLASELSTDGAQLTVAPRCVLRGLRTQTILTHDEPSIRFATAAALVMGGAQVHDHVRDNEGIGRVPGSARVAGRWLEQGLHQLGEFGVSSADLTQLLHVVERLDADAAFSAHLDAVRSLYGFVAAALVNVVDRPDLRDPLWSLGSALGTIALVADALQDLAGDRRRGRANPIGCAADPVAVVAPQLIAVVDELRDAVDAMHLRHDSVARRVLLDLADRTLSCTQPAAQPRRGHVPLAAVAAVVMLAAGRRPPSDEPVWDEPWKIRTRTCLRKIRKFDCCY